MILPSSELGSIDGSASDAGAEAGAEAGSEAGAEAGAVVGAAVGAVGGAAPVPPLEQAAAITAPTPRLARRPRRDDRSSLGRARGPDPGAERRDYAARVARPPTGARMPRRRAPERRGRRPSGASSRRPGPPPGSPSSWTPSPTACHPRRGSRPRPPPG